MLGSLSVQVLPFTPLNRPLRRFAGGGVDLLAEYRLKWSKEGLLCCPLAV